MNEFELAGTTMTPRLPSHGVCLDIDMACQAGSLPPHRICIAALALACRRIHRAVLPYRGDLFTYSEVVHAHLLSKGVNILDAINAGAKLVPAMRENTLTLADVAEAKKP